MCVSHRPRRENGSHPARSNGNKKRQLEALETRRLRRRWREKARQVVTLQDLAYLEDALDVPGCISR